MPKWLGNRFGDMLSSGDAGGSGVFDIFDQYSKSEQDTWVAIPISATGGNQSPSSGIEPGNGYRYHIFTSPGNFTVSEAGNQGGTIDYLLIGGGGGGGNDDGGGGGAGGFVENTGVSITAQAYPITIGGGGPGGGSGQDGTTGTDSTGFSATAAGGGGGADNTGNGKNGGSGGGAYSNQNGRQVGAGQNYPGPAQQGFPGGVNPDPFQPSAGGGGGAGSAGTHSGNSGDQPGGDGGIGKAAFSGDTGVPNSYGEAGPSPGRWFAGGGAGGGRTPTASQGGVGGGGSLGSAGDTNTGGGGAGGNGGISDRSGKAGGSGICIVRYQI